VSVRAFGDRPDATGVPVPAHLAGPVRDLLVAGLWDLAKTNGGTVNPELRRLVVDLHQADQQRHQAPTVATPPTGAGTGTHDGQALTVEVSTRDAAHAMGCSVEYVRRLARSGRLTARRAGRRTWLITIRKDTLDADRA